MLVISCDEIYNAGSFVYFVLKTERLVNASWIIFVFKKEEEY